MMFHFSPIYEVKLDSSKFQGLPFLSKWKDRLIRYSIITSLFRCFRYELCTKLDYFDTCHADGVYLDSDEPRSKIILGLSINGFRNVCQLQTWKQKRLEPLTSNISKYISIWFLSVLNKFLSFLFFNYTSA